MSQSVSCRFYLQRLRGTMVWSVEHNWTYFYAPSCFTRDTANELAEEFNSRGVRCVVIEEPSGALPMDEW